MLYQVSMVGQLREMLIGNGTFLGYPSYEKKSMAVGTDLSMGISSMSKYKDLAWEFIKMILKASADDNDDNDRNMLGCDLLSVVRLGIGALPYLEYLKYIGDRIAECHTHTALDHLGFFIGKNRIKNEFLNDPMRGFRVHAGE